jgi:hypothetical protein
MRNSRWWTTAADGPAATAEIIHIPFISRKEERKVTGVPLKTADDFPVTNADERQRRVCHVSSIIHA